jgi:hypothetical protein
MLALTRFADLEATVRFSPDAAHVRVPLGRRHADLLRSGALIMRSEAGGGSRSVRISFGGQGRCRPVRHVACDVQKKVNFV